MENKKNSLFLLLLLFIASIACAWEIEDINGTYVYTEEYLASSAVHEWDYSWGKGSTITETTIEFDLGEKTVLMPGMGLYIIDSVFKADEDTIHLKIFGVGDKNREDPRNMKVIFIDSNRVYIVHDRWERTMERRYSPEAKWVWYRLSGPEVK